MWKKCETHEIFQFLKKNKIIYRSIIPILFQHSQGFISFSKCFPSYQSFYSPISAWKTSLLFPAFGTESDAEVFLELTLPPSVSGDAIVTVMQMNYSVSKLSIYQTMVGAQYFTTHGVYQHWKRRYPGLCWQSACLDGTAVHNTCLNEWCSAVRTIQRCIAKSLTEHRRQKHQDRPYWSDEGPYAWFETSGT